MPTGNNLPLHPFKDGNGLTGSSSRDVQFEGRLSRQAFYEENPLKTRIHWLCHELLARKESTMGSDVEWCKEARQRVNDLKERAKSQGINTLSTLVEYALDGKTRTVLCASQFRKERERRGTQQKVADLLGISKTHLQRLEQGKRFIDEAQTRRILALHVQRQPTT